MDEIARLLGTKKRDDALIAADMIDDRHAPWLANWIRICVKNNWQDTWVSWAHFIEKRGYLQTWDDCTELWRNMVTEYRDLMEAEFGEDCWNLALT